MALIIKYKSNAVSEILRARRRKRRKKNCLRKSLTIQIQSELLQSICLTTAFLIFFLARLYFLHIHMKIFSQYLSIKMISLLDKSHSKCAEIDERLGGRNKRFYLPKCDQSKLYSYN